MQTVARKEGARKSLGYRLGNLHLASREDRASDEDDVLGRNAGLIFYLVWKPVYEDLGSGRPSWEFGHADESE